MFIHHFLSNFIPRKPSGLLWILVEFFSPDFDPERGCRGGGKSGASRWLIGVEAEIKARRFSLVHGSVRGWLVALWRISGGLVVAVHEGVGIHCKCHLRILSW